MFLLFHYVGSLDYLTIFAGTSHLSSTVATVTVLALLLAATGKSAQIPLFNWLPDAMEGPTPVSALIHAATMVTAGVYLLVRMAPVLILSNSGRWTIGIIGGVTAFVAATIATSQKDIKRFWPSRRCRRLATWSSPWRRGLLGRDLLDGEPRLLQGPSLPRIGFGHPRTLR
jgi:NADH-quinone oxidoreductase subunit L